MSLSMQSIGALRLTCRSWSRSAEKFFYRYIKCSSDDDAIWEWLSKRVSRDSNGCVTLGRHVHSLILESDDKSKERISRLMHILGGCPNIRFVNVNVSDTMDIVPRFYQQIMECIVQIHDNKLERLEVTLGAYFSESLIFTSMPALLNLHVLILPDCFGNIDAPEDDDGRETVILPNLHTLRIRSCSELRFPQLRYYLMPKLQHLALFSMCAGMDDDMPFFKIYGRQLKSLEVAIPDPELTSMLNRCPNLEDFVVSLYSLAIHHRRALSFFICHPNVKRVINRDMPPPLFSFFEYKPIMDDLILHFRKQYFLNLVTVRFIDLTARKLRALRLNPDFHRYWKEMWVEELHDYGVTIEDCEGKIIDG